LIDDTVQIGVIELQAFYNLRVGDVVRKETPLIIEVVLSLLLEVLE
jgi:hypothetical protein